MQVAQVGEAPRRVLRQLRDLMAAPGTAGERLAAVVNVIADGLEAEVCSIYVLRPGQVLELYATRGLKQEAVHKTRLNVGEGLVGDIAAHARPLALSNAQAHPQFAYKPETGEEIFHSLMGVPIQRGGGVLGVLVVQNRSFREYIEEEVETLETIAMVLAELIAGGALIDPEEMRSLARGALMPTRLEGIRLSEGLAIGQVVLHQPRVSIRQMLAENPAAERDRLRSAIRAMRSDLDDMLATADLPDGSEHREILESFRMIAHDRGWLSRITEAIDSGLTAEAAVQKVQDDNRARMMQSTDPYLRERLADLEDLTNRLLQHLTGDRTASKGAELPEDTILVARVLGPAELLDYDRRKLKAVVLEEGSPASHAAIVARALDLPMIGRVKNLLGRVEPQDKMAVDAINAVVVLHPGEAVRRAFVRSRKALIARQASYAALRDLPPITRDGVSVSLNMNAGLLLDLAHLETSGAEGVGLYRTEIPFMVRSSFPDVIAQTSFYRRVLARAHGRRVVFRTLDVGGDKLLPYLAGGDEGNPAMGWRAIRLALDRPSVLRVQLRAFLRAAAGGPLDIMFPMIAEVAEFDSARLLLDLEIERERRRGRELPHPIRVGSMLEVPALAWQLPELLKRVDFLSVGSNDLVQFLFACDRGHPRLAERYDPLSPALLSFLKGVVDQCRAAGVSLSLCGEMGGRPLEALALIGVGFTNLSMPPSSIGRVKAVIRSLELSSLQQFLNSLYGASDHSVRAKLRAYARDRDIAI